MGEPDFCLDAKTKAQISFAVTAKLISTFVFATRIVQFLLYPKLSSETVQAGLFQTWSETLKTGLLASQLMYLC